jgi:two-component system chemotaxis response regulator CheY
MNVLIVDDSAAIRKILARVLHQTGLPFNTIHEAGDGVQALKLLESIKVQLILLDVNMPNMDGLQLLTELKAHVELQAIPVVMVTSEGGEAKVLEALRLGAAGYVRKPFTVDQIKEKLAAII